MRSSRDKEKALLYRAFNKANKNQKGSSSRERGREGKGKERIGEEDKEKKSFNKSKAKCYSFQ